MHLPETWADPRYKWVTAKEAAWFLKCSRITVYRWKKDGTLNEMGIRTQKIGCRLYFEFPATFTGARF